MTFVADLFPAPVVRAACHARAAFAQEIADHHAIVGTTPGKIRKAVFTNIFFTTRTDAIPSVPGATISAVDFVA